LERIIDDSLYISAGHSWCRDRACVAEIHIPEGAYEDIVAGKITGKNNFESRSFKS